MDYSTSTLLYDGHFWVLISETSSQNQVWIARHVFGSEPTPPQVLDLVLKNWPTPELLNEALTWQIPRSYDFKKQLHKNRHLQASNRTVSKAKVQQNILMSKHRQNATDEERQANAATEIDRRNKALSKRKQKRRGR